MKCNKCDAELTNEDNFCKTCGSETPKVDFYIRDWTRTDSFSIVSGATCDFLIEDNNFYVIKFNGVHGTTIGALIGLVILNLIGLFLGGYIGRKQDEKKIHKIRMSWITDTDRLVSDNYKKYTLLQIPKDKLKQSIDFKKKRIQIYFNDKKFTFSGGESKVKLLNNYINEYVL